MAKKTNKTSHVLNLLTNGAPEGEEAKESQSPSGKETGAAAPENKVIVVNETSENEKLSNEIKNRLEAQLEAESVRKRRSRPYQKRFRRNLPLRNLPPQPGRKNREPARQPGRRSPPDSGLTIC